MHMLFLSVEIYYNFVDLFIWQNWFLNSNSKSHSNCNNPTHQWRTYMATLIHHAMRAFRECPRGFSFVLAARRVKRKRNHRLVRKHTHYTAICTSNEYVYSEWSWFARDFGFGFLSCSLQKRGVLMHEEVEKGIYVIGIVHRASVSKCIHKRDIVIHIVYIKYLTGSGLIVLFSISLSIKMTQNCHWNKQQRRFTRCVGYMKYSAVIKFCWLNVVISVIFASRFIARLLVSIAIRNYSYWSL